MKRCVGELEYKGSYRVEKVREYRDGLGMWKERMSTVWPDNVDGRSQWRTGKRETEVRLDGWCEGGLRQQRNDSGGCGDNARKIGEFRALVHMYK